MDDEGRALVKLLEAKTGHDRSDVMRTAVRLMAEAEGVTLSEAKPARRKR